MIHIAIPTSSIIHHSSPWRTKMLEICQRIGARTSANQSFTSKVWGGIFPCAAWKASLASQNNFTWGFLLGFWSSTSSCPAQDFTTFCRNRHSKAATLAASKEAHVLHHVRNSLFIGILQLPTARPHVLLAPIKQSLPQTTGLHPNEQIKGMPSCEVVTRASGQWGIQLGSNHNMFSMFEKQLFQMGWIHVWKLKINTPLKIESPDIISPLILTQQASTTHQTYHWTKVSTTPRRCFQRGAQCVPQFFQASRVFRVSSRFQFQKAPRSVSEAWRCAESHNLRNHRRILPKKGGWTFPDYIHDPQFWSEAPKHERIHKTTWIRGLSQWLQFTGFNQGWPLNFHQATQSIGQHATTWHGELKIIITIISCCVWCLFHNIWLCLISA